MTEPLLIKADCPLVRLFCTFLLNAALSTFQTVHYNTQVVARCDLIKDIDTSPKVRVHSGFQSER